MLLQDPQNEIEWNKTQKYYWNLEVSSYILPNSNVCFETISWTARMLYTISMLCTAFIVPNKLLVKLKFSAREACLSNKQSCR